MTTDVDGQGTRNVPSETELFSNGEIEALKQQLTGLQDVIGAIRASARSCASIEPAWRRKTAIVEKLQKENRRVVECSAILDGVRRWRDQRARLKSEQEARQSQSVT
jgi:hypothetical protein